GLEELIGPEQMAAIAGAGAMRFQATGDTGVGLNSSQPMVALAMAKEIDTANPANGPTFFLNLGDVIYGNGKQALYANNFYRPNSPYLHPAPGFDGIILAIPGNHDCEVRDPRDSPSLSAFTANFVSPLGQQPPMAVSFGVKMPNQPGVYFHLDAPFLDLIGLDSNAGEDFGLLGANAADTHQLTWLQTTLMAIAASRTGAGGTRKALILAMHHPPYASALQVQPLFGHAGSPQMQAQLDSACAAAGIWPDAVLSGHSHNYQRYKRTCQAANGQQFDTAYFVVGTGGIALQAPPSPVGASVKEKPVPGLSNSTVTFQNRDKNFGFVRVAATAAQLQVSFARVQNDNTDIFETVTIDLATQKQIAP
ncbi:MAG TPA: metallophosphoesterase, partial [Bryobacteraceae bacterium]